MVSRNVILVAAVCSAACGTGTASGPSDAGQLQLGTIPVVVGDDAGGGQAIAGDVSTSAGASASGVSITLEPGDATTSTDTTGSFIFEAVAPGTYVVTASLEGYATASQTVTITEGNDESLSITLERSQLLVLLADAGGASPFLGYAPWVTVPDAGTDAGTAFFFGAAGNVWELVDGGAVLRTSGNSTASLVGFDARGGAVVATDANPLDAGAIHFLDPNASGAIALDGQSPRVVGDALLSNDGFLQQIWYADAPGFLAPEQIAIGISTSPTAVPVATGMVGWQTDPCPSVQLFGLGLSLPLTVDCAGQMTPLTASIDGDRVAFIAVPDAGPWEVVIDGETSVTLSDGLIERVFGTAVPVYPLSAWEYAVPYSSGGSQYLLLDSPLGSTEMPMMAWAPMHGVGWLVLAPAEDAGSTPLLMVPSTAIAMPFPYPWTQPSFSASNRYVVFPGTPSLFDLETQVEAPLTLTPARVAFDRAERHALITDATGNMAIVPLATLSATTPQGVALEGVASDESFTADEKSVAYFGFDVEMNQGFFVEALPAGT